MDYKEMKRQFRKMAAQKRDAIPPYERKRLAGKCLQNLLKLETYSNAGILYCYISFRSEMPTDLIIDQALAERKRVAVPKIENDTMNFYEISSLQDLRPGCWGIPEPQGTGPSLHEPGLAIVPGLGFDDDLYRIGYGGGFYDRFLCGHPDIIAAGIAFEAQIFPRLPREKHDKKMDFLVTDTMIRQS